VAARSQDIGKEKSSINILFLDWYLESEVHHEYSYTVIPHIKHSDLDWCEVLISPR
jgi:hypothetical protein